MLFHGKYMYAEVFLGHLRCAEREEILYFMSFHEFYNFFDIFFKNVKNIRICTSNTANVCMSVHMLETALRQKIFNPFSWIDKSDFLCRDSKTLLKLFQTLRSCFKQENSRSLVGAKSRFQIGSDMNKKQNSFHICSCQSRFGSEFSPQPSSVSFHVWSMT